MSVYLSVERPSEVTVIIEKSKFIARAQRVTSAEQAESVLSALRIEHKLATHNCFGYVADKEGVSLRFSDDGEPSGTAGMPILDTIRAKSLKETLVTVTRYFGGIKLGAGGLVRAYRQAALSAIEAAGEAKFTLCVYLKIRIDYTLLSAAEKAISRFETAGKSVDFLDAVEISVAVPSDKEAEFCLSVSDATLGKAKVSSFKSAYLAIGAAH